MVSGEHIRISDQTPQRLPAPISVLSVDLYANDVTSQSGRPISEANAPQTLLPLLQKTGISMKTEAAPYPDSRKGYPINRLAYEEITRHWSDFLNNLALINNGYFEGSVPEAVTVHDIQRMSEIGMSIPSFLVNRGENPYKKHGELPDVAGEMTKINAGIRMGAEGLLVRLRELGADENMAISPNDFYRFAEKTGLLKSTTTQQVCAAPPQIMIQAFEALFFQENADPSSASLKAEFPDFAPLQEYSGHLIGVQKTTQKFSEVVDIISKTLQSVAQSGTSTESRNMLITAALRQYRGIELSYLAFMSHSQHDINRTLGREYTALQPLTTHDLTKTGMTTPYQVAFNLGIPRKAIDAVRNS